MQKSVAFYGLSLGLGILLALALAAYGWRRRRRVPGGAAFAIFNIGVALWTSVSILAVDATGPDAVFWANMAYFGIGAVPASWLVFAIRYSGRDWRITHRVLALLCIEPAATLLLAWTNPWHLLFRLSVAVTPRWEPGPAFWVHAAYSYSLVLTGTVLVAQRALKGPRLGRGQAGLLLVAALAPLTANAIYLSGTSPLGNLDLTPFGFGLTSLAVAWGLFHELEQRAAAAERRFRALIDHAFDSIEVVDPETGRFLDVNQRACAACGYTRDEYLALSVPQIDPRVAERSWKATRDEVKRLGTCVFESEHRRKDGSVFPVELSATYVSLERDYVLTVVRDITDRKRAEAKFKGLLESAPDAMVIADEAGTVILVNAETERVFGYRRAELLGRPVERLLPARYRGPYAEQRSAYMARPYKWHSPAGLELHGLRGNGTEFPVQISVSPLQSEEGTLVSAAVRDVTERKRMEEQLRQAQKMEAVGQLAGGVAHDFNNILGIVIGHGGMILRLVGDDERLRPKAEQILKAAERAAALTRQLLAFSRQQVLQPQVLDLNAVVTEMEDMLRRLIGEDVTLVTALGPGLGSVEADQGQVQQVIMNLAVNARDAMPDGGQLKIETSNVDVDEGYAARFPPLECGRYVMLGVTDTGIGMSAEIRARAFEPFFTTKGVGKGTGLGLSTVFGIVEQSGGSIHVESDVGAGSCFKVYLPRIAAAPSAQPEASQRSIPGGSETLLLVEDEAGLRELLQDLLEGNGYRVLVARDGIEASRIAAAHSGPIQLMVTDVVMPGATGRKAAEAIQGARPDLRVLYISGYTDDATLLHGALRGAGFLGKPFALERFLVKVRELLDAR